MVSRQSLRLADINTLLYLLTIYIDFRRVDASLMEEMDVFEDVYCAVRDEKCSLLCVIAVMSCCYVSLIDSASSIRLPASSSHTSGADVRAQP